MSEPHKVIRPDDGYASPFRRKIESIRSINSMRSEATLSCGHKVLLFGDLSLLTFDPNCMQCENANMTDDSNRGANGKK